MAGYAINGNPCTSSNGCAPSKHAITYTPQPTPVDTLGGVVLVDPPSGLRRVHTWEYDGRDTSVVKTLLQFLDLDNSPVVIIDTYDVVRDAATNTFPLLTSLVCMCQKPEIRTAGQRDRTEAFSLVFSELYPQS